MNATNGLWYGPYGAVLSVSAQSMTISCDGVFGGWTPVAVSGATGVSVAILWINISIFGEQNSVAMLNFFRKQQLYQRQLPLDSTRRLALTSTCVAGMTLANLSKGQDKNVYQRNIQSAQVAKQQADALGVTSGIFLWDD